MRDGCLRLVLPLGKELLLDLFQEGERHLPPKLLICDCQEGCRQARGAIQLLPYRQRCCWQGTVQAANTGCP